MKLYRPTENTKFHIDYAWFEAQGQDVKVLIYKCLTAEQQEQLGENPNLVAYDYVDEETGEVRVEDQVLRLIRTERATDPNFISARTPITEAAFRAFLVNGNAPLTAAELADTLHRKPSEVLAQLGGRQVHTGVRPIFD